MYTTRKTEIAKLRAYKRELDGLYSAAADRHDLPRARALHELRSRVSRAILLYEEWNGLANNPPKPESPAPASVLRWPRAA
jgi:hypothetical protein